MAIRVSGKCNVTAKIIVNLPNIVRDGLQLWLDANNLDSYSGNGSVWGDLSGNSNNASIIGATWDSFNRAFNLQSGDYFSVPDKDVWDNTNLTLSAWFYRTSTWSANWWQDSIIAHDEGPGYQNKWIWSYDGSRILFHINTPAAINITILSSTYSISLGTWYNFVMTKNSNIYNFYVNGVPTGTASDSTSIPNANCPLIIGTGESGALFNGKIANVLFYNKSLSETEVVQNYVSTKTRFGL